MKLHERIKALRQQRGLLQKQVAAEIDLGPSHYNKIENGQRELSVEVLCRLARFYGLTVDEVLQGGPASVPEEVQMADASMQEQLRLLGQLDERERQIIYHLIEAMLTKARFKAFFEEHLAA